MKSKFKVGDEVVITNPYDCYPSFDEMIEHLGVSSTLYVAHITPTKGDTGIIVASDLHCWYPNEGMLYAVLLPKEGRVVLMGEGGIVLKTKTDKPKIKKEKVEPPKPVSKIIFHYSDCEPYTVKGITPKGEADWGNGLLVVFDPKVRETHTLKFPNDVLAIEWRDDNGDVLILTNPKYKSSVKVDIKTNRQRCKEGNKKKVKKQLTKYDLIGKYEVTPETSEALQKLAFKFGWSWNIVGEHLAHQGSKYLSLNKGMYLGHLPEDDLYYFKGHPLPEKDVDEVLKLARDCGYPS